MAKDGAGDHQGIPRDANDDPIFLILPPGVQESYDRKLSRCRAGWQATGDPAFVIEAQIQTHLHRQPPLLWLTEAVVALATKRRTKGYAKRAFEAHIRWMRFDTLRTAKKHGLRWLQDQIKSATEVAAGTNAEAERERAEDVKRNAKRRAEKIEKRGRVTWEEAGELASEALAGLPAAGKSDVIRKDYDQVKRECAAGQGAQYLTPLIPRKKLADAIQEARDTPHRVRIAPRSLP
jgi:hypothetical protein